MCDIRNYEQLANAIILQAVRDLRDALKKLKRNPNNRDAQAVRDEITRFFKSGWFSTLTSGDGKFLLRKICEEVQG
ncbi:MAG: hypothetical protein LUF27_00165 [Lachnospiraceae bacterium]|nr:hypothetical protein [Lachnospiraceae bacterium]